ncbi:unnamed protein product [Alopecurus aequalis]
MITWRDLYTVMSAVVPLYVAMILAYGSVRWWAVITPEQCAGINRFVAVFAVPLLSFKVISASDLYALDLRFVAADTLQKLLVLAALAAWSRLPCSAHCRFAGGLDWYITLFSFSTLPNTLIMGIPLLVAMYGPRAADLLAQLVVLQCIVWYTLLLVLFEFRAARALIAGRFAVGISAVHVDPDVVSLDGSQAEVALDGTVRVSVVPRSPAGSISRRSVLSPRPSNLTGIEIDSVSSSPNHTPRGSSFTHGDFSATTEGGGALADLRDISAAAVTPVEDTRVNLHMFEVSGLPVFSSGARDGGRRLASSDVLSVGSGSSTMPGATGGESVKSEDAVQDALEAGTMVEATEQQPAKDGGGTTPPATVMLRLILAMVWRRLIRNPNTYASVVGLTWSLIKFRFHITMPVIVANSISILSDAGLGMAMFSLGLFMAMQPKIIACGNTVAAATMAVRFIVGPAVMAVASAAVGLRGTLLAIAIVQAAVPQGIVPFVFAKEYNLHAAIVCTGVIFGMLIALPIAVVYYIILGLL